MADSVWSIDPQNSCRYLALHVIDSCNLTCSYCFAYKSEKQAKSSKMAPQTAIQAVNKILSCSDTTHLKILFFGGEPLLVGHDWFRTVCSAISKCAKSHSKTIELAITTNGTRIDNAAARLFSDLNIGVCISIDGPPELHNKSRGCGADVLSGLKALHAKKIIPNSITVLNPYNVRHVKEVLAFLEKNGITKGRFTPMTYTGRAKYTSFEFNTNFEVIIAAVQVFQHMLERKGEGFVDLPLMRRARMYSAVRNGQPEVPKTLDCYTRHCWAGIGYLAVNHNGNMYPCSRSISEDFRFGSLANGVDKRKTRQILSEFHNNGMNLQHCETCEACIICFAGCSAHNKVDARNFYLECAITKALYEYFQKNEAGVLELDQCLSQKFNSVNLQTQKDNMAMRVLASLREGGFRIVTGRKDALVMQKGTSSFYLIDTSTNSILGVEEDVVEYIRHLPDKTDNLSADGLTEPRLSADAQKPRR